MLRSSWCITINYFKNALCAFLWLSFQTEVECMFTQVESKRGGVAGGPAGLQQNLAGAV